MEEEEGAVRGETSGKGCANRKTRSSDPRVDIRSSYKNHSYNWRLKKIWISWQCRGISFVKQHCRRCGVFNLAGLSLKTHRSCELSHHAPTVFSV